VAVHGYVARPSTRELLRAARLLVVRSRRQATGLFAGNYASAFRGGGLEFDESRPYVPGDDVRSIDWNATARHGETYVKQFREERDQTLVFALDASASMRGGSAGASLAGVAAQALALLSAAAGRAGDSVGLVAFDAVPRAQVPAARGVAHGARVVHTALACAAAADGTTDLAAGLRAVRALARSRHAVIVLLSDFRDDAGGSAAGEELARLARRHDVVAGVLVDALELALPRAGRICIADPEAPDQTFVLDTGSRRQRATYLAACAERRARLLAWLRRAGADPVWLRGDRSPLHPLGRFFRERAARRARVAA
jgi:uncharacterized protein (DUF58 family)